MYVAMYVSEHACMYDGCMHTYVCMPTSVHTSACIFIMTFGWAFLKYHQTAREKSLFKLEEVFLD